jgi:hypothetical protein
MLARRMVAAAFGLALAVPVCALAQNRRRDLQKDLNRTSREIYRAKHNNREPK